MQLKKLWKKVWYFVWEDNSIWSWIINIILAFVLIKFLVYPGLGWALGTGHPVVAVVSGSMEHDGSFEEWWSTPQCCNAACSVSIIQQKHYAELDISEAAFQDFPWKDGFNKGDIMILYRPKNLEAGDVIVYATRLMPNPIIHRVVSINSSTQEVTTKGDHNCGSDPQFEYNIPQDQILGKAIWRLPWLGWIKIGFAALVGLLMGG